MPLRNLADTDLQYHLVSFDQDGHESTVDPDAQGGLMSDLVREALSQGVTDVFICSHGWMGDIPRAIETYDSWMGAVAASQDNLQKIRQARPEFQPLLIGIHWPSKPFGSHDPGAAVSFSATQESETDPLGDLIEGAADGIADTPAAREALRVIVEAAAEDMMPDQMPPRVIRAYEDLWAESDLGLGGLTAGPGDEGDLFDPELLYQDALDEDLSFGQSRLVSGLLKPLQLMSFWKMKKRARSVGETGVAALLRDLQSLSSESVRFHLMGHSFGCIVISATVAGANGDSPLPRPVDTVFLAQGALSCWAYTPEIPIAKGKPGYFQALPKGKISGPLVTTQSVHDSAVGTAYPLATSRRNVSFGEADATKPARADGALGAFGVQGPGVDIVQGQTLEPDGDYGFEAGRVYNLEGSAHIKDHNDIASPQLAHAFWSAVRVGVG